MVSGCRRRRRLRGRARGAARQRKGNPSRTLAGGRVGVGARGGGVRAAPLEVPGPGLCGPAAAPGGGVLSPPPPLCLGTWEPPAGPPAVPRASALGLRWKRLGGRPNPDVPGEGSGGQAGDGGHSSCPCGRRSPAGLADRPHLILSSLLKLYLKFTLRRQSGYLETFMS